MSYSFAFWAGNSAVDPEEAYMKMNLGEQLDSITPLDREAVLQGLLQHLAGWSFDGQFLRPPGTEADGGTVFDVHIGGQMLEATAYSFEDEQVNALIDAMRALGLRLFDPQVGVRFE